MELISREEVNELMHNQREMQSRVNQLRRYDGVEWHPYPQEKPKADGYYNVTLDIKCTATAHYNPKNDEWRGDIFWVRNGCIIAWAELPEPYKEGAEK